LADSLSESGRTAPSGVDSSPSSARGRRRRRSCSTHRHRDDLGLHRIDHQRHQHHWVRTLLMEKRATAAAARSAATRTARPRTRRVNASNSNTPAFDDQQGWVATRRGGLTLARHHRDPRPVTTQELRHDRRQPVLRDEVAARNPAQRRQTPGVIANGSAVELLRPRSTSTDSSRAARTVFGRHRLLRSWPPARAARCLLPANLGAVTARHDGEHGCFDVIAGQQLGDERYQGPGR